MSARRVTVLIDSLIPGGAERVAVDAAAALDPDRYVAHLLVTRHSGSLEARVREAGLDFTILGRQRGFHPRRFAQARSIVRASDVLHAHKFAGSAWGALLSRTSGRPLVAHEHTFDGSPSRVRALVYRRVIGPAARRVVCVSSGIAASLRAEGVPEKKLVVVPNGVPVDGILERQAARAVLGLRDGPVVGMVARLRPEKRHELALAALAASADDIVLCVVGDGPRAAALHDEARRLGVDGRVVWAGEHADARRLMRAFDALLVTSSFEGMPLAVLEALVAGVPVVSTDVGVMRELLAEGAGAVVDQATPDAIAAALASTIAGPPTPAAAQAQRARYGLDRLVGDLQDIYDEVLEGP
jgi:glycosyltransferase involved in cell wall biosynthesis